MSGEYFSSNEKELSTPKISYPVPPYINWVVSHEVIIDDSGATWGSATWESTVNFYPWASGEGTKENPYKIRYVLFNGRGFYSGLVIKNSDAYFIIEYCGFINSSPEFSNFISFFTLFKEKLNFKLQYYYYKNIINFDNKFWRKM